MSRDWRPVELYITDKQFKESKGSGLRDNVITFKTPDGQERLLSNMEMRQQYPELEFVAGDVTKAFYDLYKDNKDVLALFDELEIALRKAETEFDKDRTFPSSLELWKLEPEEIAQHPIDEVVKEWFYGNLDNNFYYNTENDEIFTGYITQKIEDIVRSKDKEMNRKEVKGDECF